MSDLDRPERSEGPVTTKARRRTSVGRASASGEHVLQVECQVAIAVNFCVDNVDIAGGIMEDDDDIDFAPAIDAMNRLYDELASTDGLVCVGVDFVDPETIVVHHLESVRMLSVPSTVASGDQTFGVRTEISPAIVSALAPIEVPRKTPKPPFMGGDPIMSARRPGYWGTISMFGDIRLKYSGRENYSVKSSRAIMSNNHVIACSDDGKRGDRLYLDDITYGELKGFIPLSDPSVYVDVALGVYDKELDVTTLKVRGWSKIKGIRSPKYRNEVVRKHGARTGKTVGVIESIVTGRMDGKLYRNIWRASRGMGCPGDSGSLIISDDKMATGVLSWGEDRPCKDDPRAFFWGFNDAAAIAAALGLEIDVEDN